MRSWLKAAEGTAPTYRWRPAEDTKIAPFAAQLTKALEIDARRPKRDRRTALKLFGELKAAGFDGNTMIDTLLKQMPRLRPPEFWSGLGLRPGQYFVVTLHRPANVDGEQQLLRLLRAIADGTGGLPVVFPVHPRTAKNLRELAGGGIASELAPTGPNSGMRYVDPQGYLEFNYLVKHAKGVITDSGGITEETTVMGVPCLTLRDSTERPETVSVGSNELIGTDPAKLGPALARLMAGQWKKGGIPDRWDGKAAVRIVAELERLLVL